MDIPLLNKEDIEKEGGDIGISIRDELIEFLKGKGYRYECAEDESAEDETDEIHDFFIKDDQLVQIIINDEIPKEILEQIVEEWRLKIIS
jgi:hypothetical protein